MTESKSKEFIFDGELEIILITEDLHDDVIKFQRNNFLKNENLCNVCGITNSEEAMAESAKRLKTLLQNGFGFAIRVCKSKDIVALCLNKIVPSYTPPPYRTPCLQSLGKSLACMDSFDILKEWNIDCYLEIMYLTTRNDYGGRGLATMLAQRSINIARQMFQGTLVDRSFLPLNIRNLKPKAVTSLFTSKFTQKIGEKLGMENVFQIPYSELFYENKTFAEKIEPIHKYLIIGALRL